MMFSFFRKRKIHKRFKQIRKAADYRFACDNDLLTEAQLKDLNAFREQLHAKKKFSEDEMVELIAHGETLVDRLNPLKGNMRSLRNFLDVLAVAFGVAFGLRALYIQPFKIPTSSMQPTLFGIHYVDRANLEKNGGIFPKIFLPLFSQRAYLKVESDGELGREYSQRSSMLINEISTISIGGRLYDLPGNIRQVSSYIDCTRDFYKKGDVLCDGWLVTGDHVFVERISIHFRGIKRGDVAVFNTEKIVSPTQPIGGYYYIKRIVGLPGDTVRIRNRILEIRPAGSAEFKPSTVFSDKFKKVDSMQGGYQGHIADGLLADGQEVVVPQNSFFALGDNTSNSLDGRNWGFIPRKNMIGLAVNIFWPVSRRWGIVDILGPVTTAPTELPGSMFLQ